MGAASAAGYCAAVVGVRSDNSSTDLVRFLTIFLALSALWGISLVLARRFPPSLFLILSFAILFRIILLPAGYSLETRSYAHWILYDDDVWRYLWEAHAWSADVNPMQVPPADLEEYNLELTNPALYSRLYGARLWSEVYDNVGYREVKSPYPLLAHAFFRLAHWLRPGSVLLWKLIVVLFDLAAIVLLMNLARGHPLSSAVVLAYSWNPLVIKEFAGTGHMDAILVFLLLAGLSLPALWGSLAIAAAALIKPVALMLVPAFWRRAGWKALGAPVAAITLYFVFPPEGLRDYSASWTFNPAFYRLIPLPRPWAMAFAGLILCVIILYRFLRDDGSQDNLRRQYLWLFGSFLLLTPMFAPWYLSWLLPVAALTLDTSSGAIFWLALSGSVFLSYHASLNYTENWALILLEFATPVAVWLWSHRDFPGRIHTTRSRT